MNLQRTEMLDAINVVKPALAGKDLVEELTHIWFDGNHAMAYDSELGIQVPFATPFQGGIRGTLLFGLLHNSRAKEVVLEPAGEGQMVLKAARARATLAVLPAERAVWQFPKPDKKEQFPIDTAFVDALKTVLVSVGNDSSTPEKLGVTICFDKKEMILYTTDSRTIARAIVPTPKQAAAFAGERVILPTGFCQQVIKLGDKGALELREDCAIASDKNGVLVYSRLIESEKPLQFDGVFAKHSAVAEDRLFEIPSRLHLALERVLVLFDGLPPGETVELAIKDGKLRLYAKAEGRGELKDSVDVPNDLPEVVVYVAPELVLRALPLMVDMAITNEAVVMHDPPYKGASFGYLASTTER